MNERSPADLPQTISVAANPNREAIATVVGQRLLFAFGIILAILFLWGFTTGPALINSGQDVTTTIPDSAPVRASTVQLTE
jgi:hypothetical protein